MVIRPFGIQLKNKTIIVGVATRKNGIHDKQYCQNPSFRMRYACPWQLQLAMSAYSVLPDVPMLLS
jgi:hypothetical protein